LRDINGLHKESLELLQRESIMLSSIPSTIDIMPKSLPPNIQVRQMRPDDIVAVADMLIKAPDDGSLYMYPQIAQLFEHLSTGTIRWLRTVVRDQTTLVRLVVVPHEDGRASKIIGYSSWRRKVLDPKDPEKTYNKNWRERTWGDSMYQRLSWKSNINAAI
jgi:hypothetical protein